MQIWNGFQRGINLGGWLSQCDHTDRHYDTFITENDIAHIASWGMDHVRVPIDYELIEAQGSIERESGYARIACCLRWCKKHNLNVVLVLHKTYGYNPESAYASSDFFENPALQARFISLWNQLAKRFQSYSDILAFELLDQVLEKEHPNRWNRVVAKTIDAIRGICPAVPIVVSGIRNDRAASIPLLQLPADECTASTATNPWCSPTRVQTGSEAHPRRSTSPIRTRLTSTGDCRQRLARRSPNR